MSSTTHTKEVTALLSFRDVGDTSKFSHFTSLGSGAWVVQIRYTKKGNGRTKKEEGGGGKGGRVKLASHEETSRVCHFMSLSSGALTIQT